MFLAQLPPGFDESVTAASGQGWEAIVLVVVIFAGLGLFGVMFRQQYVDAKTREEKLSNRVTKLEDSIRDRLFLTIDDNAKLIRDMTHATTELLTVCKQMSMTLTRFQTVLDNRPCMALDAAERLNLVEALTTVRKEQVEKALRPGL